MNTFTLKPKDIIHLMHGTEDNNTLKTKTGCRKTSEHREVKTYVFWKNRVHVNCEECLKAVCKIEMLRGE